MNEIRFLNHALFNTEHLLTLLVHFCINLVFIVLLIQKIYLRINRNRDYLFIFYVFNILVFFLGSLLSHIKLETGFAFGLFALFSIIRYRTQQIPIKEMTFLFASIILATVNSTVTANLSYAEILFANLAILGVSWIMERNWLKFFKPSKSITYEKIELIVPEKRKELIADLEARTGLRIISVKIVSVNFLRDTAKLLVYYKEQG